MALDAVAPDAAPADAAPADDTPAGDDPGGDQPGRGHTDRAGGQRCPDPAAGREHRHCRDDLARTCAGEHRAESPEPFGALQQALFGGQEAKHRTRGQGGGGRGDRGVQQ